MRTWDVTMRETVPRLRCSEIEPASRGSQPSGLAVRLTRLGIHRDRVMFNNEVRLVAPKSFGVKTL